MNRKTRAAMVSVCSNISLIIMKMVAGFASGSVSIISEAIHSAMDLVAALIALFAVKSPISHPMNATPMVTTRLKMSPVSSKHCLSCWPRAGSSSKPSTS